MVNKQIALEDSQENPEQKRDEAFSLVSRFFQRRKHSTDVTASIKPKAAHLQISNEVNQYTNEKGTMELFGNSLKMSDGYFVSFKNNRIIPDFYKKRSQERMNRTMMNLNQELGLIRRQ